MGMFDSVFVDCPRCGIKNELQTKDGPCILGKHTLVNAPPAVILGVEGVHTCEHRHFSKKAGEIIDIGCGKEFEIFVQCITKAWVDVRMQAV